jgi:tetraacyldisaccharide 4'-kinase
VAAILDLASYLYSFLVDLRQKLYSSNILKSEKLPAKTISVGNITVGGTGKTPMVIFLAKFFAKKGENVCVLTRGYKRKKSSTMLVVSNGNEIEMDSKITGDEPLEIALSLRGVAKVIADADRIRSGRWAIENFQTSLFILDDAFQHFRVKRDLDLVLVDATNPFGNGRLLPAGILRESLENLKRASAIVITRSNLIEKQQQKKLKDELLNFCEEKKIFLAENSSLKPVPLKEFINIDISNSNLNKALKEEKSLAFCSIGNPKAFFQQLREEGFNLVREIAFPDHYSYKRKDIEMICAEATKLNAFILTTAKDAVKLRDFQFDLPCFVLITEILPEKAFEDFLIDFWNQ